MFQAVQADVVSSFFRFLAVSAESAEPAEASTNAGQSRKRRRTRVAGVSSHGCGVWGRRTAKWELVKWVYTDDEKGEP